MGLCSGKEAAGTGDKKMTRTASQHALFSSLALKFPLVRRTFRHIRSAFQEMSGGKDEEISASRLKDVMRALGASTIDDQQCQELFALADLDGSQAISWREFMIAVGVGYYLKDDVPGEGPHFEENKRAFKVIQDAFFKIDKDRSGEIDAAELKKALFDVGRSDQSDEILENRFAELDVNSDKTVSFEEFLFGFISWVGMDEDEDDDEDDACLSEADTNSLKNRGSANFAEEGILADDDDVEEPSGRHHGDGDEEQEDEDEEDGGGGQEHADDHDAGGSDHGSGAAASSSSAQDGAEDVAAVQE